MIYLLSQMLVVVAAAIILGVAVGWLVHRATHASKVHELTKTIRRQRAQVAQAKSEVNMLNDDYNELKRSSQDQISALQQDNQQIPDLLDNLEKSQLLVQQNMKRHESRVRNLTTENQRLEDELAAIDPANAAATDASSTPSNSDAQASRFSSNKRETREPSIVTQHAAVRPAASTPEIEEQTKAQAATQDSEQTGAFVAAESDNDPFDQVMEVSDDFQFDFDQTNDATTNNQLDETVNPHTSLDGPSSTTNDAHQHDDQTPRFAPSTTQDDLQQIFGIGPLTEKALNDLGITSYSQLAQLKKHDIEHIADALDIGAGRIERDNWVGNARRQLEDVLEQL